MQIFFTTAANDEWLGLCAQASLSRPESALGLQDLFSPTAAQQQQGQGLSMFSAPSHPPPSAGFELESPRGSFGGDPLASPHFHYGGSSTNLQAGHLA